MTRVIIVTMFLRPGELMIPRRQVRYCVQYPQASLRALRAFREVRTVRVRR